MPVHWCLNLDFGLHDYDTHKGNNINKMVLRSLCVCVCMCMRVCVLVYVYVYLCVCMCIVCVCL